MTVSDLRILYRRPFKKYVTYELMEEVEEKSDQKMRQRQRGAARKMMSLTQKLSVPCLLPQFLQFCISLSSDNVTVNKARKKHPRGYLYVLGGCITTFKEL